MPPLPLRARRFYGRLGLTFALVVATACAQPRTPSTRPALPAEPVRPTATAPAEAEAIDTADACPATVSPEVLIAQIETIRDLEDRLHAQQLLLDDAIQEVVRVKAKQRSIESRAEAASALAEAEIALASYREETDADDSAELARADRLLRRATEAFDGGNFGGALYLTGQAKSQIRLGRLRRNEVAARNATGLETPFAAPRSLEVTTRANFRSGAGRGFEVLDVLDAGTAVTGLSSKAEWIRVARPDGSTGWIHESLLAPA